MPYPEFKSRYNILAARAVAKAKNDKLAAKVFFRAGILGYVEEVREDKIGSVLSYLQASVRGKNSRIQYKKLQEQKLALYCVQRAIRAVHTAKTWKWAQLWMSIKPNLKC